MSVPHERFRKFDRHDLEEGLRQMNGSRDYSEELKQAVREELLYRIEHPGYETDCRATKVLTGGYDLKD